MRRETLHELLLPSSAPATMIAPSLTTAPPTRGFSTPPRTHTVLRDRPASRLHWVRRTPLRNNFGASILLTTRPTQSLCLITQWRTLPLRQLRPVDLPPPSTGALPAVAYTPHTSRCAPSDLRRLHTNPTLCMLSPRGELDRSHDASLRSGLYHHSRPPSSKQEALQTPRSRNPGKPPRPASYRGEVQAIITSQSAAQADTRATRPHLATTKRPQPTDSPNMSLCGARLPTRPAPGNNRTEVVTAICPTNEDGSSNRDHPPGTNNSTLPTPSRATPRTRRCRHGGHCCSKCPPRRSSRPTSPLNGHRGSSEATRHRSDCRGGGCLQQGGGSNSTCRPVPRDSHDFRRRDTKRQRRPSPSLVRSPRPLSPKHDGLAGHRRLNPLWS